MERRFTSLQRNLWKSVSSVDEMSADPTRSGGFQSPTTRTTFAPRMFTPQSMIYQRLTKSCSHLCSRSVHALFTSSYTFLR